ncbi:MAG: hypothetical protein NVS3B3_20010 [Aquirhabdus sp.]
MLSTQWIWQQENWPHFTWQEDIVQLMLRHIRLKQGVLLGTSDYLSPADHRTLELESLLLNILNSSAIEGEALNAESLRASLAERLNLTEEIPYAQTKRSDALVELTWDAVTNLEHPLTRERLFKWHQWIFVEQNRWAEKIRIGQLRVEDMEVISGLTDNPTLHFKAQDWDLLEAELDRLIEWFNLSRDDSSLDPLLRAAIIHLWFVTVHPFDDGNGRIARALADLALAQAEPRSIRNHLHIGQVWQRINGGILDRPNTPSGYK